MNTDPERGLSAWDDDGVTWLSAYLFYAGTTYTTRCDRVIRDVVEPVQRRALADGWADRIFFIRYSEDGPHVRIRFRGRADALLAHAPTALQARVDAALDPGLRAIPYSECNPATTPETGRAEPSPRRIHDRMLPNPTQIDSPIRYVPYQREIQRYGGEEAVRLAEDVFQASTHAVFQFLREMRDGGHASRLGKGLLAMVVKLHVFTDGQREQAAELMERYRSGYLQAVSGGNSEWKQNYEQAFESGFDRQAETLRTYVDAVWARMEAGEELSESLDPYRDHMLDIRDRLHDLFEAGVIRRHGQLLTGDWFQAVCAIVPSYIHMTNNRLGVPIPEESYLAHCIRHALQPEAAATE